MNFHQLACLSQFSKQRQKDNTNLGWRRISWSLQKFEQLCDFLLGLIQGVLHFPWNTWPWFLSSYICRQKNRTSASSYGSSSVSYTETVEPVHVPKRPSSKIPIPCHSEKLKLLSSFQDTWKRWNISTQKKETKKKSINIQRQHVTIRIVHDTWKFNCNVQAKGWQVTHFRNSVSIVKTCELYSGISKSTTRSHKCVKTAHCSPASQCPGSIHKQEVE